MGAGAWLRLAQHFLAIAWGGAIGVAAALALGATVQAALYATGASLGEEGRTFAAAAVILLSMGAGAFGYIDAPDIVSRRGRG